MIRALDIHIGYEGLAWSQVAVASHKWPSRYGEALGEQQSMATLWCPDSRLHPKLLDLAFGTKRLRATHQWRIRSIAHRLMRLDPRGSTLLCILTRVKGIADLGEAVASHASTYPRKYEENACMILGMHNEQV